MTSELIIALLSVEYAGHQLRQTAAQSEDEQIAILCDAYRKAYPKIENRLTSAQPAKSTEKVELISLHSRSR